MIGTANKINAPDLHASFMEQTTGAHHGSEIQTVFPDLLGSFNGFEAGKDLTTSFESDLTL